MLQPSPLAVALSGRDEEAGEEEGRRRKEKALICFLALSLSLSLIPLLLLCCGFGFWVFGRECVAAAWRIERLEQRRGSQWILTVGRAAGHHRTSFLLMHAYTRAGK